MSCQGQLSSANTRTVPPYVPTSSIGVRTDGFSGSRSSTGGNSPAATRAASIGASPYLPVRSAVVVAAPEPAAPESLVPPANASSEQLRNVMTASVKPGLVICVPPFDLVAVASPGYFGWGTIRM